MLPNKPSSLGEASGETTMTGGDRRQIPQAAAAWGSCNMGILVSMREARLG